MELVWNCFALCIKRGCSKTCFFTRLSPSMEHEFNQEIMNSILREPRPESARLHVTRYAHRMGATLLIFSLAVRRSIFDNTVVGTGSLAPVHGFRSSCTMVSPPGPSGVKRPSDNNSQTMFLFCCGNKKGPRRQYRNQVFSVAGPNGCLKNKEKCIISGKQIAGCNGLCF